jgi:hypothetical protein
VWLVFGDRIVHVRDAATGELLSKIEISEEATAITSVGARLWIATSVGKLFIFGADRTLLGVLQPSSIPAVSEFHSAGHNAVITTSGGKDFALWDATQFSVERTFFGRIPGEVINTVLSVHRENRAFVALSNLSLRLWSCDGECLAELQEGGTCGVHIPTSTEESTILWIAQRGWITVFSISSLVKPGVFCREKTIPCASVTKLLCTGHKHVCSLDKEGLVTVWNTETLIPDRSFKIVSALQSHSSHQRLITTTTHEIRRVALWTCGGERAMIWWDEHMVDPALPLDHQTEKDLEMEEIRFLRKKLKCVENMTTAFRQKVGTLFRERASSTSLASPSRLATPPYLQAFNELDQAFASAMGTLDKDSAEDEPLPEFSAAQNSSLNAVRQDCTDYWKQRYYDTVSEISRLRKEHESIVEILKTQAETHNPAIDGKRAFHICQIIKEKNELREVVRQQSDDISRLRAKLMEYNSPLGAPAGLMDNVDHLRNENKELLAQTSLLKEELERQSQLLSDAQAQSKQNQLLKQRVRKLKSELDIAQMQLSDTSVGMQQELAKVLDVVASMDAKLKAQETASKNVEATKAYAELEIAKRDSEIERLDSLSSSLKKELEQRERIERRTNDELRSELRMMCQSLDDRDAKITELIERCATANASLARESTKNEELAAELHIKGQEIAVLREQLHDLRKIIGDRKGYAKIMGELQGRMEMMVEELRQSFTPVQFSANIQDLEMRVSNLFSLESQLRQKDDIIAIKDDEIQTLKEHAAAVDQQIQEVSAVFSHLPVSVEEVERLLVEVDEYRRRLAHDPETQELIQIRLLDLNVKRKAGGKVPLVFDMTEDASVEQQPVPVEPARDRNPKLEKLRLFSSATEDKLGLNKTPQTSAR